MNSEEFKLLTVRLAALTDLLEQRSQQAVEEVAQSSGHLEHVARSLGLEGQRLAADAVSAITVQARDVVARGMQQALNQCSTQLQHAAQQATQTAMTLREHGATLKRTQQSLLWRGGIALLVAAVLAASTFGFLAWKNWEATRQADFNSAIVHAVRSGTLTQCDGMLCVKAAKNAVRYVKNGDYVLLKE